MNKKFLKGALEERKGVRAKAKTFAIPQRERDANERGDEKIREVRSAEENLVASGLRWLADNPMPRLTSRHSTISP